MAPFEKALAALIDEYRGKATSYTLFTALGKEAVRAIEHGWNFETQQQLDLLARLETPAGDEKRASH